MDLEKKRKLEVTDASAGEGAGGAAPGEKGAGGEGEPVGAEEVESLRHMLSLFSKEQLAAMLLDAAVSHASVRSAILGAANKDVSQRKLFVRGLSWETTTDDLLPVFAAYGEVEEGAVVMDKTTGKSRGFAFVTFKDILGAHRALKEPSKKVLDRVTVCNLAALGGSNAAQSSQALGGRPGVAPLLAGAGAAPFSPAPGAPGGEVALRKVYVWGLAHETTTEGFLAFFRQFGEIEEGAVTYEKVTRQSRGFGFVTYKTAEAAKKAIDEPVKMIDGKSVSAKYAAEGSIKEKMRKQQQAASPFGLLPAGSGGFPGYQHQQAPAQAPASLFAYQQQPQAQGMYGVPQLGGYQMPGAMGGYPSGLPGMAAAPAGGPGAAGGAADANAAAMAAYNAQLAAYAAATAMSQHQQHQQQPAPSMYGAQPGAAPAGGVLGSSGPAAGSALPGTGGSTGTPAASAAPAAQYAAAAAAQYAAQLAQYQSSQAYQ